MNRDLKQSGESWIGRYRRAILTLVLFSAFFPWQSEGGNPTDVDKAEARYLKKMLSFVEWPSQPESPTETFRVCVAADYRIAFPLSEELRGVTMTGRKISVQMIGKTESPRNCQVPFIGSPESKLRSKLLEFVKGTQVLTVGDDAGFLEAGGILEFVQVGGSIQFAANLQGMDSYLSKPIRPDSLRNEIERGDRRNYDKARETNSVGTTAAKRVGLEGVAGEARRRRRVSLRTAGNVSRGRAGESRKIAASDGGARL